MRWIRHIFIPFISYLPLLGEITFLPWRFVRSILSADKEYEERLRRYSFFLIALHLIISPYIVRASSFTETIGHDGGLLTSFKKEIVFAALIVIGAIVYLLLKEKRLNLTLDEFLNFIIPLEVTTLMLETVSQFLAQTYLIKIGLPPGVLFGKCKHLHDFQCISSALPVSSTAPFTIALINTLFVGHFMALLLLFTLLDLTHGEVNLSSRWNTTEQYGLQ